MMLEARHISLRLGGEEVLRDLSVAVRPGELLGLIGPNGAGKTSLLRVLANLQRPDGGEVCLGDKPLAETGRKELARSVAYLAQAAPAYWPLKVRRLVELGRMPFLAPWQALSARDDQLVEAAMRQAEVTHLADRVVTTLSGGERLRVLLARLFASQPTVILADEPIAALDPYHQLHTMELFANHCQGGGSAVVIMHDLSMAARFCDRLVLLDRGSLVCEGCPQDVLADQRLSDVYGIRVLLDHTEQGLVVQALSREPRVNR